MHRVGEVVPGETFFFSSLGIRRVHTTQDALFFFLNKQIMMLNFKIE